MDEKGNPPTYNQGYSQPYNPGVQQPYTASGGQQTVVVPTGANTVIVQQPMMRPPTYMWLSCLVYWCCNCIAGVIAFALSMASSSAADENRMDEARNYGKASLYTSIAGVILGVTTIIVIIVLYVTLWNKVVDNINDNYKTYYSSG